MGTGRPHEYPFAPLSEHELGLAAALWAQSKNTHEIAQELQISEARVFNSMGVWMPRARRLAAAKRDGISPSTLTVIGGGK